MLRKTAYYRFGLFRGAALILAAVSLIMAAPAGAAESETAGPLYYLNETALNLVFEVREPLPIEGGTMVRRDGGQLNLPGGRIGAGDGMGGFGAVPFLTKVEPGRYPVAVFNKNYDDGDQRTALAAVFFNDSRAVRWEMAVTSSKSDPSKLGRDDFFGYAVDSGTGCFISLEAAAAYGREVSKMSFFGGGLTGKLLKLFEEAHRAKDYAPIINFDIDPKKGLNMAAFSSGLGDGSYPSYFGYDAEGRVCCLVTDFLILEDKPESENAD